MSSNAKVLMVDVRHGTRVKAIGVFCAKAANATTADTAHVNSAKATHVATAKAAHSASTVSSASAASGLRLRGKQAPGQYCACQYRYHSSFHDFLHFGGGGFSSSGPCQTLACLSRVKRQSRDMPEMRTLGRLLH